MKKNELNIYNIIPVSEVNGPGKRFCIWVQGCRKNCPGCFNQEARGMKINRLMSVTEVFNMIMETRGIEGITFSGGEPFLQAGPLLALSRKVKKIGLSLFIFTGCLIENLKRSKNEDVRNLLKMADVLVDGAYKKDIPPDKIWVGSGNQRVHFLTDRYKKYKGHIEGKGKIEIIIDSKGDIQVTGFKNILKK